MTCLDFVNKFYNGNISFLHLRIKTPLLQLIFLVKSFTFLFRQTFAKYANQIKAYEIVSCLYISIIRICNSDQLKLIFGLIPFSPNQ